jgi:hypothetical protein
MSVSASQDELAFDALDIDVTIAGMQIKVDRTGYLELDIDSMVSPVDLKYVSREFYFDVDLVAGLTIDDVDSIAADLPAYGGYSSADGGAVTTGDAYVCVAGVDV